MVIAIVQVGVIVAAGLLARRVGRLLTEIERDIKPIFAQLQRDRPRCLARGGAGDGAGRARGHAVRRYRGRGSSRR